MDIRKNRKDFETYKFWREEITAAQKRRAGFYKTAGTMYDQYRNDQQLSGDESRYGILYANTEILLPILYNQTPAPACRSKRSTTRPEYKSAASILEGALSATIDSQDFDGEAEDIVLDYALIGMGTSRLCYDPVTDDDDDDAFVYDSCKLEFVNYKDFLFGVGKRWNDKPWIAYRGFKTEEEIAEIANAKIASSLKYATAKYEDDEVEANADADKVAEIWEIWDKETRQRIFIAMESGHQLPLDIEEDPYKLKDFFPSPRPMRAIKTPNTFDARPFYSAYQEQAIELDEVCTRIMLLTRQIKRRGAYKAGVEGVEQIYGARDDEFIPIQNWPSFQEGGGLAAYIQTLPFDDLIAARESLYKQRNEILNVIYQAMGLADIMRGSTDAGETAKAQKLKSQYGMLRVNRMQREVQRYFRDVIRMMAELIAENYSAESIAMAADVQPQKYMVGEREETIDPVEYVETIIKPIIKPEEPRSIAIDIETDSTVVIDEVEERTQATEMTRALVEFTQNAPDLLQAYGYEVTSELLLALIAKFKMPRQVQEALQERIDKLRIEEEKATKEAEQNPKQPEPSPEQIKMQVDMQKLQLEQQKLQIEGQIKIGELQIRQREVAVKERQLGISTEQEQQKIDLSGAELLIKQMQVKVEAANPYDNAVVGV